MAYATYTEFKEHTTLVDTSGANQASVERLLDAASRNIDRFCNRPDGFEAIAVATARKYAGSGTPYQRIHECVAIDLVEVKNTAADDDYDSWNAGDWIAFTGDPRYPDFNALPYTGLMVDPTGDESIFTSGRYITRSGFRPITDVYRGVPTVQVTAKWGYSEDTPDDIKMACIMQAARWFKRMQGNMADAVASGDLGMMMYIRELDPDIQQLLIAGRYIRPAVGLT